MAEGCFQSELFYALGAFTIRLPPLRERRDDIPLLVDHIIKHFAGIRQTLGGELTRSVGGSPGHPGPLRLAGQCR